MLVGTDVQLVNCSSDVWLGAKRTYEHVDYVVRSTRTTRRSNTMVVHFEFLMVTNHLAALASRSVARLGIAFVSHCKFFSFYKLPS